MLKGVIILSLENVTLRRVSQKGTSLAVVIPPNWAKKGEHVCVAVKDDDTLIISKKLVGAN
jgi:antitoxin component of MazEF toxin-antitoxin module